MTTYKYICNVCNITFDDKDIASSHISKIKHKKKTEELILNDPKIKEDKKEELKNSFEENDLVSEKDIYYSKMIRVDLSNESRKYIYFCKFCSRQFVRKDTLIKHMKNTCKSPRKIKK